MIDSESPKGLLGRHIALAACVMAAATLNVAAIGAFADVVARWRTAPLAPSRATVITVLAFAPTATAEPPSPSRTSVPDTRIAVTPSSTPMDTAAWTKPTDVLAEAIEPVRYYRFSEVDRPAMPDSDWNLDPVLLDAVGLSQLVFEVFVSSSGEVVGCTILEPQELPGGTRQALEGRLSQTVLQPAQRIGIAVASVRRIELSVQAPE